MYTRLKRFEVVHSPKRTQIPETVPKFSEHSGILELPKLPQELPAHLVRPYAEVEPYLERVWVVSLRVVDDIKETVRLAGGSLCRTVRGLTVRLTDAHHSSPKVGRCTLTLSKPVLKATTDSVLKATT